MAFLKNRNGIYYIIKKERGAVVYSKSTKESNERLATKKLEHFIKHEEELLRRDKEMLFSDFVGEYMSIKEALFERKTVVTFNSAVNEFLRHSKDKYMSEYTTRDMDKFMRIKIQQGHKKSAARIKRTLSPMFNLAIKWGYAVTNPWKETITIEKDEADPKFISREEYSQLIDQAPDPVFSDIITWAVFTGMRQMEIVNLKVKDINTNTRIISVLSTSEKKTKGKRTRHVELYSGLLEIINKYSHQEYLFENSRTGRKYAAKTISETFKDIVRKLGLDESITFHSLRSTFGMWLLEKGVNIKWISQQLGHSSVAVTERYYAKYIPDKYSGEIEKFSY